MNLSLQQQQLLQRGEAVPMTLDGTDCVLLRKDVYERLQQAVQYDDSEWTPEEMRPLAARTFADADTARAIRF